MTEEKKNELYALLVQEIEAAHKAGQNIGTRYDVCCVLIGWFDQIDREHLEIIEKLYADNFIDE